MLPFIILHRPTYSNAPTRLQEWPPHVPRATNPTALYRTTFALPPTWCVGGSSSQELGEGTGGPGWPNPSPNPNPNPNPNPSLALALALTLPRWR